MSSSKILSIITSSIITSTLLFQLSEPSFSGDFTTYGGVVEGGSCSFKKGIPMNKDYGVAMNSVQYDNSLSCGSCVSMTYNGNTIIGTVVDICPECKYGDLDLFTLAYKDLLKRDPGRFKGEWEYINCPVSGNIKLTIDEVNYYWLNIRPENFKCGISKLFINLNNNWIEMTRDDKRMMGLNFIYNGFISGDIKFRIVNKYNEIRESNTINKLSNIIEVEQFNCQDYNIPVATPPNTMPFNEIIISPDASMHEHIRKGFITINCSEYLNYKKSN